MSDVDLGREGVERTVCRIRLDPADKRVTGSINKLLQPLRSGSKS